ncbi:hypothetical protein [Sagittula salina]|uniref:Uncharacterized protein n=1 Tax=Sagittula salina TaxID=2820268 RepID=A0A940MPR7_9RHOB|nr:hypothetical protein [Sagittula salina]MBP0483600.1 hypothetical protein [Sagittula salina]
MQKFPCTALFMTIVGFAALPALAQTGAAGEFTVVNDTDDNLITGFYTSEDGETFSDNWLAAPLGPGEAAGATFHADSGACTQYFVVGWAADDGISEVEDDVTEIDICDASVVYLGDNEISYE